jgi:hypothetical protein
VSTQQKRSCAFEHLAHVGREVEALRGSSRAAPAARLVDRHLAALERSDLLGEDVARVHLVAELGEAGPPVTRPDPANADNAYRFREVMDAEKPS